MQQAGAAQSPSLICHCLLPGRAEQEAGGVLGERESSAADELGWDAAVGLGGRDGKGPEWSGGETWSRAFRFTLPCFASIHAQLPWEPLVCCEASFTLTPLPAFTLSLCDFLLLFGPFNKEDRNGRQRCSGLKKEFSQNLSEGMWGRETVGPSWRWLKSWGLIYKQVLGSILKTYRDREAQNSVSKKKL